MNMLAGKIEAQLKAEVAELLAKAEAADKADIPDSMSIPDELARREDRLQKIAEARAKIEARAKERFARERAEHEAKLAVRKAKTASTGKKPSGKPPQPPSLGPLLTDQINLTNEESRIMPVAGGGFEQCYNAQAAVAEGSLLVVAIDVVQAPNDKQQLDSIDAANELVSALVMGLWNRLTRHQDRNSPFRLTRIETAATREGLAALALMRVQEIEGFVQGLFGRQEEIDLPERANRALDDLGKMRAMFAAVRDLANDETKTASLKDMETTLRHMREMTKNAEHAMHTVLLSCKRARRQMLAGMPESKPTMH